HRRFLALRRRGNPVPFHDVPNRLRTERVAQIATSTGHAVIAPATILLCKAHNHGFPRLVDSGTPWRPAIPRTVELLGNTLAMPSQNRVSFPYSGPPCQCLLPPSFPTLGEGLALAVAPPQPALDLLP